MNVCVSWWMRGLCKGLWGTMKVLEIYVQSIYLPKGITEPARPCKHHAKKQKTNLQAWFKNLTPDCNSSFTFEKTFGGKKEKINAPFKKLKFNLKN